MRQGAPAAKHRIVAGSLRRDIQSGQWRVGERLPGEHILARRFDVAYMTMRQAVESLVDEGVLVRVRGKGTFVSTNGHMPAAASLTNTLIFSSDWLQIDPYYLPGILDGFTAALQAGGGRTSFVDYADAEILGKIEPGAPVACLLINRSHQDLLERLRDRGHPVLAINRYTGRRRMPCVRIDDSGGVEDAVGHLAALGHKRIGFLLGNPWHVDSSERRRGFRLAARRHFLTEISEAGGDFSEASGYEGALQLLAQPNAPTALVCASDLCALGALRAARERGLDVPGDLSVVGFGDFSFAEYTHPALTTVRQARRDLGKAAAQALVALAQGEDLAGAVLSAPLIERETTGRCRHGG